MELRITYLGGPTALVEFGGLRVVTDPTFDPAGTEYPAAAYTLRKTQSPAVAAADLGAVDAVLLSHEHHADNLDHAGRRFLASVPVIYTTVTGAERLGGTARGLTPWQSIACPTASGGTVQLTAVPARHGPAGGDRGPVLGFVLEADGAAVYFSGDTVWFDGVEEIGRRFRIDAALLNLGAAKVSVAGPQALTFTAAEAVELARRWPHASIVPLHFEGWEHFTEGRGEIESAFRAAGFDARVRWLAPGAVTHFGKP
jgi:L-ascorbate metabolism protein UlaG (beta-lactamase superfamily)